jgi:fermentation-respiration switch protein FrsA (DUF1100 family)
MIEWVLVSGTALAAAAAGSVTLALYPPLPRDLGGAPDLDARARRLAIPVGNGDVVEAWHVPGDRRAVIVLFHGYGRTHHRAWRYASFLVEAGYHVVAVEFRSSRPRRRKPTTLGHFEEQDARAALEALSRDPELQGKPIGLFGESLGASVALKLAAAHTHVGAVVADCPFASAGQALEDSCERLGRIPRPSAYLLRHIARTVTGIDPGITDTLAAMASLRERPVFFIHSVDDDRIAPDQTLALWRAAGSKDPLWLVPGVGHNEAWVRSREAYERRVRSFFDRHLLGEGIGLPPGAL